MSRSALRRGVAAAAVLALVAGAAWLARSPRADRPPPAAAAGPSRPLVAATRPDIVLVSLDAVRPDHLSCYGHPRPTSPAIDRLAAEGVLFERCLAQAPWTLPSHMSLFTSLLPTDNCVDCLNTILPSGLTTLAEVLAAEGYETAALVNDGQMRAHWGFDRGFATWREFAADTPAGAADQLTDRALEWLAAPRPAGPFLLFLHYYDAHDPYEAPLEWRRRFGVEITGPQARQACFAHRAPGQGPAPPAVVRQLKAAYDAEIAGMDHELGRLFAALSPETLVVVFSDHGECFGEHGWMLHGATLTEPDIRAALVVRPPRSWRVPPRRVADPVALLDVAPTLVALAGGRPHPQFVGADLSATCRGAKAALPPRLIPAETKAVLDGRYLLGVTAGDAKAVYSLFDGTFSLLRLPHERAVELTPAEAAAAEPLFARLKDWIRGERFWLFEATGAGDHEAVIYAPEAPAALFIPAGLDPERDRFEVSADGRRLVWRVHPAGAAARKLLLVRLAEPAAALKIDYWHNGRSMPELVRLGPAGTTPDRLPTRVDATLPASDPLLVPAPVAGAGTGAAAVGLTVTRHAAAEAAARGSVVAPLEGHLLEKLRSLGYVR